jgi:hypothetical protein
LVTRACEYENDDYFKQIKTNDHLTRPHSFRDAARPALIGAICFPGYVAPGDYGPLNQNRP